MGEIRGTILKARAQRQEAFEKGFTESHGVIEKSDIMQAISRQDGGIVISKTGAELKEQAESVLLPKLNADLAVKEAQANKYLALCGQAPTKDAERYWTMGVDMDCGYKVYDWGETYIPEKHYNSGIANSLSAEDGMDKEVNCPKTEEESRHRQLYNREVEAICNIKVDIRACEMLLLLKDSKDYELAPSQLLALKF